ncbi:MAG: hypothetical protein AAGC44_04740 [Planctomycetota bacterium]
MVKAQKSLFYTLAPACICGVAVELAGAGEIEKADATQTLGPDLLIDQAAPGGSDMTANQPEKLVGRVDLASIRDQNVGAGGTRVTITGIAWASPNAPRQNDAETVTAEIRYLGRDGVGGNRDDVVLGSASASLNYNGAGEYAWVFDEPISGIVDGQSPYFRIDLSPANEAGNGTIRVKAVTGAGPKFSVAGKTEAVEG